MSENDTENDLLCSSSLQQRSSKFKHFVSDHHPFYGHQQQQQQQQHHKSYDDDQRPLLSNYVQISGYLKTNLDVLYDYYNENRIHQHQKQSQQSLNYYDQSSKIKKMMIIDENFLTEWYRLMYALIERLDDIVCDAYKSCGFGCFVHHMAYCLIAALALNRTLILYPSIENFGFSDEISSSSKNNHYYQRLFKSFKSINSICDINSSDGGGGGDGGPQQQKSPSNDWMSNAVNINDVINHKQNQKLKTIDRNNNNDDDDDDNIELIYLPIIENLDNRAKFRPMAIPEQLRKHLEQLTRMPFVVFLGSIISYIMRLNDEFERKFLQYRQRIKFRINDDDNDDDEIFIGIHVRRTDKLFGEGEYYPLSDYMKIVQRIYDRIDIQDAMMMMEKNKKIKKRERKIYLATDDITVWQNEVPQYIKQGYRFYGDSQITKSASPGQRNTAESFDGFIMDVLSLSYTDYLVCTFSSQVCRLAYELMQVQRTNGRDMSTNFYSLDDVYYFGGQISHRLESIMANHHPPPYVHNGNNDKINNSQKQHKFNVGDSLGIEKNLHNGYYLGDLYETKIQRLLDQETNVNDQQQQQEQQQQQQPPIDVGIEATTLPLYDSKSQLINCMTLEDYKLLETMNNFTMEKFQGMTQIAQQIQEENRDLNDRYRKLLPKLEIIDKLDRKVTRLEKMAYAIDAYSKRLGMFFFNPMLHIHFFNIIICELMIANQHGWQSSINRFFRKSNMNHHHHQNIGSTRN
ncbi:Alpha-(1,6)-fucosyltransferase, variant 3 [Dermatophagoides farinae]|uniref:Alpha-(1,6)-fucosyltransferase, variant 3 n=1 Tax=Dermatophagoides farinae TaxID=6954 RepID=A0A922HS99_DERFA|nr:Alpha-(1,6)-fucosyltransferase, variant 3 [Dermatophagoides farinae]